MYCDIIKLITALFHAQSLIKSVQNALAHLFPMQTTSSQRSISKACYTSQSAQTGR